MSGWPLIVRRQDGMALIVSLVILLSMTLLGLAAIQNTTLEERMAGTIRAENMAFQAAEAALRQGEAWLDGLPGPPAAQGDGAAAAADGVWLYQGPNEINNLDANTALGDLYGDLWWFKWSDPGIAYWDDYGVPVDDFDLEFVAEKSDGSETAKSLTATAATQPYYVIEEFGYVRDHLVLGQQRDLSNARVQYAVTARGVDAGGRSEVLLGSRYQLRF